MTKILSGLNALVWGAPALILILGVGLWYSLRLRFVQLRLLPRAIRLFCRKLRSSDDAGTSSFRALCTALAATVGTGNLVGVAGAICLGGPGAIFWMWVCGIFGMVTKYAETVLAVRYRVKSGDGYVGGPMYVMTRGLGEKFRPMAAAYCLFGVVAAFGVGNATQINAVATGVHTVLDMAGIPSSRGGDLLLGALLAGLIATLMLGGAGRIGTAAEYLVPAVSVVYVGLCLGVLISRAQAVPGALAAIFQGAFRPRAVTGGMLGSAFRALQVGCSRGVFTNEAGMGTASIAHAAAQVRHPAEQGLMGIMEVFLDTIVICTMTALAILCSGVPIPYGIDAGAELTSDAFAAVYGPAASVFLALSLGCFAVATVLGWGLYGARCAEFLFGAGAWRFFAVAEGAMVFYGVLADTATVWQLAETVNGLMAIPNLITLAAMASQVVGLTLDYQKQDGPAVRGGTYADIHQRQPL